MPTDLAMLVSRGLFGQQADALGRPPRFILTPGQAHDLTQAHALLDGQTARQLIADRGYDSNGFRSLVAGLGAKAVIPAKKQPHNQHSP